MNNKLKKAYESYKRELNYRRLKGSIVRVLDYNDFIDKYRDYQYGHQLSGKVKESIIKDVVKDSVLLSSRQGKKLAKQLTEKTHKAVFTGDIQKLMDAEVKMDKYAYTDDYEASADYDESTDFRSGEARQSRLGDIANELDLTSAGGTTTLWEMAFSIAEGDYEEAREMYDEWVS